MINEKRVLAIISARGGSKRVVHKNIRELAGKPLFAWTVEQAKESKYIDRLILSSDDMEIIRKAKQWGCEVPFVRPSELSKDDTPGIETILHALEVLPERYSFVVLLQPTSPLRNADDINRCIEMCIENDSPSCVSIVKQDKNPKLMDAIEDNDKLRPLFEAKNDVYRCQSKANAYILNGAVYVADTEWLKKSKLLVSSETVGYVMPKERSCDIDTEFDMEICNIMLQKLLQKGEF